MMKFVALLFLVALVAADIAPLLHADGPDVVPNSYIIVLKDHLTKSHRYEHIGRLQYNISYSRAEAKIGYVYNIILAFHAILDSDLLKQELEDPEVKYIEAVQIYKINIPPKQKNPIQNNFDSLSQPNATWGLVRVSERTLNLNAPYIYNSAAGNGVDVYVIDTGILASHVDFGGRVTNAFTAIKNEANTDLNGHGTHCAGTIGGTTYGVAKNVSLFAVKVLSASGSGTTDGVIAGVDYVLSHKRPDVESVASMSLGGGASTALDNAIIKAIAGGVVFVVAAGNDNAKACNYSPARVLQAITVGATTNTDARSSFSNYGSCVDIFAPGSSITSDWIGNSNTTTNTISGTSMATPHVAGIVALHLSFNIDNNPAATKDWLIGASTPNVVTNPGVESPNRLAYSPAQ